jgi:DnaK suppressor protein
LESIDNALRQAQDGRYGICERCGEPIDPARLEVVPEATLCVRCKTATER